MTMTVLIVDESEIVRENLKALINAHEGLQVIETASSANEARQAIKRLDPDVLTLAIEMPKMNGIKFLEKIMELRPMPVVIISTLAKQGSPLTLHALHLGAIECICKPTLEELPFIADKITDALLKAGKQKLSLEKEPLKKKESAASGEPENGEQILIAIGASTGGTEAIKAILKLLPKNCPGIVVTQHMPKKFTNLFAARLDSHCKITVKEAQHDEAIRKGFAYIAPGDKHLCVIKKKGFYYTQLNDHEPVNLHKPSVDLLFQSVAENVGRNAIGIILTGMGKDGAQGLLKMKQEGAYNIGQDESSSIVYGMPKEANRIGAVSIELPLSEISPALTEFLML
jgi:two-component system chemotaxis response regulator CheB